MQRVDRYAGELLMVTGIVHLLVGLRAFRRPLLAIGRDGVVDAVMREPDRRLALWFLMFGLSTVQMGGLTRWAHRRTGTLPAFPSPNAWVQRVALTPSPLPIWARGDL